MSELITSLESCTGTLITICIFVILQFFIVLILAVNWYFDRCEFKAEEKKSREEFHIRNIVRDEFRKL